ncbi:hypothetical protein [Brevirhabdus pacifica]|nr:hypothetical protein [Brevirhabdus pacifica]
MEELLKHVRDSALSTGGGGPYDGGGGKPPMERVAALEAQIGNVEHRFDGLDTRLDRIEDKIPSKWDMAQVVFFVVGGLMAAAIFGPRIAAMIPTAP